MDAAIAHIADAELVARVLRRDRRAFSELYRRLDPVLDAATRRLRAHGQDAEACEEFYGALWERILFGLRGYLAREDRPLVLWARDICRREIARELSRLRHSPGGLGEAPGRHGERAGTPAGVPESAR